VTLPLETGILYGPLFSRRLGLSLGINLLPVTHKVCTFDCIYCHYGFTNKKVRASQLNYPTPKQVYTVVEQALRSSMRFDTLTFSGNGEPTLHPDFNEITTRIKEMRDLLRSDVTLTLYSNASTIVHAKIFDALQHFDQPILKLDAGDQQTFEQVNRPSGEIKLADIIAGLKKVPHLIVQTLLVNGPVSNSHPAAVRSWQEVIADLQPKMVQLYSCDYPVPDPGVQRVLPYVLKRIAGEAEKLTGVKVTPYWIV
jgi:wyosine [tRNA(Phe)-imidazoG37] synthetase (radical SAM superfamily)